MPSIEEDLERILGSEEVPESLAAELRDRFTGPLRIAIAGRVSAGKSTLVNALVGDRIVATDASECTHIPTEVRLGSEYRCIAHLPWGTEDVPIRQGEAGTTVDELPMGTYLLSVEWPSNALRNLTLVDTPGLGSLDGLDEPHWLAREGGPPAAPVADGLLWVLGQHHPRDPALLESLRDRALIDPTAANTVAVLGRADEIGGGGLDAMAQAQLTAQSLREQPQLAAFARDVVAFNGLLAETANTLTQAEFDAITSFSSRDSDAVARILESAQVFVGALEEQGRRLFTRFGLFGLRVSVDAIRNGAAPSAQALSEVLREASGLNALRDALDQLDSSSRLRVRTQLRGLGQLELTAGSDASRLVARLEHSAPDRLVELVNRAIARSALDGGDADFTPEEMLETYRVVAATSPGERLAAEGPRDELRGLAAAGALRWRRRALDARRGPTSRELSRLVSAAYDEVRAELA